MVREKNSRGRMRVVQEEEKWWIPSRPQLGGGGCVLSVLRTGPTLSLLVAGAFFLVDTMLSWGLLKKRASIVRRA